MTRPSHTLLHGEWRGPVASTPPAPASLLNHQDQPSRLDEIRKGGVATNQITPGVALAGTLDHPELAALQPIAPSPAPFSETELSLAIADRMRRMGLTGKVELIHTLQNDITVKQTRGTYQIAYRSHHTGVGNLQIVVDTITTKLALVATDVPWISRSDDNQNGGVTLGAIPIFMASLLATASTKSPAALFITFFTLGATYVAIFAACAAHQTSLKSRVFWEFAQKGFADDLPRLRAEISHWQYREIPVISKALASERRALARIKQTAAIQARHEKAQREKSEQDSLATLSPTTFEVE